ncbi:MAG: hypothetical protein WAQ27_06440 [Candidatus Microsaccharimonas sp.]
MSETNSETFVNLDNARNEEQRRVMETIQDNADCPFCPDHLAKYHKLPILRTGENWLLTTNQWPYENTVHHFLAIAAYHAESLSDLQPGAFEELKDHFAWAEDEFKIASGGIAMRFGDTSNNGATVRHLHAHLIQPKPDLEKSDKVRFKIG